MKIINQPSRFTMQGRWSTYEMKYRFCSYYCLGNRYGSVRDLQDASYTFVYLPLYQQFSLCSLPKEGRGVYA